MLLFDYDCKGTTNFDTCKFFLDFLQIFFTWCDDTYI